MNSTRRRDASALLFFLSFFFVFASGRIASLDAGRQLRVSMLLALTGSLSDGSDAIRPGWEKGVNGRSYQPHDIGNALLMLPAAWVGGHLSQAPTAAKVDYPPVISRVAVSLTCAALAAIGCWWLFRLFAFYTDCRVAFLCTLAFPCTTIFLAYARAAWDVLGACCLLCGVLYYSAAVLRGIGSRRDALVLAAALAAACSFRYSLTPFIVPAALYVVLSVRRALGIRTIALVCFVFGALMVPSLWYNQVRTGSLFIPATATGAYLSGQNELRGNILHGLYSLLISPNRGLFVFSPVLVVIVALPFIWTRLAHDQRRLLAAYGAGSLCYVLLIAKLTRGTFGWGPRHLVPVLPVVFSAAVFVYLNVRTRTRAVCVGAAALSALLTFPSAVVNWHLATTTWAEALNPEPAWPYQQIAAWKAMSAGLKGESLPVPAGLEADDVRATTAVFPDLMLARLARYSRLGFVAALLALGAALSAAILSAHRLTASGPFSTGETGDGRYSGAR